MKSINIEGGDKIGKHTAFIATSKLYRDNGYDVLQTDFPQYWFFGTICRKLQKSLDINKDLSGFKETELRCNVFALDRLLALIAIKKLERENSIVISDRGFLSNALTLGFARSNGKITEKEVQILADNFINFDMEYYNYLKPLSILLSIGNDGKNAMEKGEIEIEDLYENPEPQTEAYRIYKNYLNIPEVNTQINGHWRNKKEIANEIIDKSGITGIFENEGKITVIGPQLFLPMVYGEEWRSKSNLFGNKIELWQKAFWDGNKMGLKTLEPEIANTFYQNPPSSINFEIPGIVKKGFQRILNKYPLLEQIIKENTNQKYFDFIKSIEN